MRGKILARVYSVGASDFSTESFWMSSRTEAQSYRLRPLLARLYRPQR